MGFIHDQVIFALGVFLLEAGWEALVFGHFFQPSLGALTFTLYSPSWLILALHLWVKQMLTSVTFLLSVSCDNRSYTVQASFLINMIRPLASAFNAEGTYFP